MTLPVPIPAVTNDDLINFHKHAFGTAPPPNSLLYLPTSPGQNALNNTPMSHAQHITESDDDDDDDDLGHYPDGRKRTLTDEQVAMFRHSEIYSIVRARQVKRENEGLDEEEDGEEEGEGEADGPSAAEAEEASSLEDITRAAPVPSKMEEPVSLEEGELCVTAGARNDAIDDRARRVISRLKRRKLNRQRNMDARGDGIPSRRVIRELDAAVEADEPELDY